MEYDVFISCKSEDYELAEEQRKETIKKEIEGKEADYRRFSSTLVDVSRQIIEKRKQLGESKK